MTVVWQKFLATPDVVLSLPSKLLLIEARIFFATLPSLCRSQALPKKTPLGRSSSRADEDIPDPPIAEVRAFGQTVPAFILFRVDKSPVRRTGFRRRRLIVNIGRRPSARSDTRTHRESGRANKSCKWSRAARRTASPLRRLRQHPEAHQAPPDFVLVLTSPVTPSGRDRMPLSSKKLWQRSSEIPSSRSSQRRTRASVSSSTSPLGGAANSDVKAFPGRMTQEFEPPPPSHVGHWPGSLLHWKTNSARPSAPRFNLSPWWVN